MKTQRRNVKNVLYSRRLLPMMMKTPDRQSDIINFYPPSTPTIY